MPNPICRDGVDPRKPCQFASVCHEDRQQLQHRYKLRGPACWAYELLVLDAAYQPTNAPVTPVGGLGPSGLDGSDA